MIRDIYLPRLTVRRGMVHFPYCETIASDARWNLYPTPGVEYELESGCVVGGRSGEDLVRVLAPPSGGYIGFREEPGLPCVGDHAFECERNSPARHYLGRVVAVDAVSGTFTTRAGYRTKSPGGTYRRDHISHLRVAEVATPPL